MKKLNTPSKSLFSRLRSNSRRNKAARGRFPSLQSRRRILRAELLEDRRLLAAVSWDEPGNVVAYFVSGQGGAYAMPLTQEFAAQNGSVIHSYWNGFRENSNPGNFDENSAFFNTFTFLGSPATHRFASREIADDLASHMALPANANDIVLLVGYSLGGTTVLEAAEEARNRGVRIDVLATIDPVSTGPDVPGFRYPLQSRNVYENVGYFYNRWQNVYPYPIDIGSSGSIPVANGQITVSDQESANEVRRGDGSRERRGCSTFDYLTNNCVVRLFASNYTTVSGHVRISEDEWTDSNLRNIVANLIPEQHPAISVTGAKTSQFDSEAQRIGWSVDGRATSVDLRISRNSQVLVSETGLGLNGSYSFDNFGLGKFQVEIVANGYKRTSWRESITVSDEDLSAPTIILGGSSGTISDQQSRQFEWSASDASGLSSVSAVVTGPSGRLFSSSDPAGLYSLNSQGPGNYRITVNAIDADNDWSGDKKTAAQKTRAVTVYDDDITAPSIAFFDSLGQPLLDAGTSQSHGLDNRIGWNITDSSGLSSVLATLKRDGQVVDQRAVDGVGTMDLNGYSLGAFELTLTAADGDADGWAGDTLVTTSKAYLTVTNAAPTVFVGGPYVIDEGDLLGLNSTGVDADPGDAESLAYSWDLNGDGVFEDVTSRNPVLTWRELQPFGMADDGTYPVMVRVEDIFGEIAFSSAFVTVNNASPSIVSIQAPPTVSENAPVTLTGSFTDAGSEDTHRVLVNWGDGSTSEAAVDAATRTFTATHTYVDDQPTSTSSDDYTVQVTVIDDDGGVSGDELRSATVQTSHVGGIAFPSFAASIPNGMSGLLLAAHSTVAPSDVMTENAPAQVYMHTHEIDFPPNGPFNLESVETSSEDAGTDHFHSFPSGSATEKFSGGAIASYFLGTSDKRYSLRGVFTTKNGAPADHDHQVENAEFETETTFKYRLPNKVLGWNEQSDSSLVQLNGSASHTNVQNTRLTPPEVGKTGSMIVRQPRRTTDFEVDFDQYMYNSTAAGADGMAFGYAPMATNALFGEEGLPGRPGLWVLFDTFENSPSDRVGIEVWYNNTRYKRVILPVNDSQPLAKDGMRGFTRSVVIDMQGTTMRLSHPAFPTQTFTIPGFNPSSNWRFGFGARTGGLADNHTVSRVLITDRSPMEVTTGTIRRTSINEYRLPKFDQSLGTLTEATTKLTLKAGTTKSTEGTAVPHSHTAQVQVGDFVFVAESISSESASSDHAHLIEFSPVSMTYTPASPQVSRYLDLSSIVVTFAGATTSADFGHSHEIAPEAVRFDAITTFEYDASKTLIRVQNALPVIESLSLDSEVDENGVATLTGSFSDVGSNDAHEVIVEWGDGQIQTLAIPFGNTSFAAYHLYRDDDPSGTDGDTFNVTVRVKDDDTGETIATRAITINNRAPVLTAPVGFTVDEGQVFQLPTTRFTDSGIFDSHSVLVDWGDGQSEQATVFANAGSGIASASHAYADDGSFFIGITVSDDDSASDSVLVPVTVRNLPPEIQSLGGQLSGAEGASLIFAAVATDPGADTLTYTWDFGDGSDPVSGTDLASVEHLFAGDGIYAVQLTVSDEDGGSTTAELTVSVSDVAARMLVSGPASVEEAAVYTLTLGEIVDPGNDPISGIQVDWGDGISEMYPSPAAIEHIYPDGPFVTNITVSLIDQFNTVIPLANLPVAVQNVAPVLDTILIPATAQEGASVAFSASASDTTEDTLTYAWDFGDGSQPTLGATPSYAYADDGLYQVVLTVSDEDGGSYATTAWITVSNIAPTADVQGEATALEGSGYSLLIDNYLDPGDDTLQAIQVDWGDGTLVTYSIGEPLEHVYVAGPAEFAIVVALIDDDGIHPLPTELPVVVSNAAPTINALAGDLSGNEAQQLSFQADVTDPGGAFDTLTYTWDFGDGSSLSGIGLQTVSHAYADDGQYALTLSVTDDDGGTTQESFGITVVNVAPRLIIAGPPAVDEGNSYGIGLGPVTDPGNDTVTGSSSIGAMASRPATLWTTLQHTNTMTVPQHES